MNNPTMLIFHHTDLDGMGVRFVATQYAQYNGYEYKTFACNYSEINECVMNAIEDIKKGKIHVNKILIGDISVLHDAARALDKLQATDHIEVCLRDHHGSAKWLNKYPWAKVSETDENGIPNCGTKLVYEAVKESIPFSLNTLVDTINDWDCWLWKEHNNEYAKYLNMLHRLWGDDKFVEYLGSTIGAFPETSRDLFSDEALTSAEVFNSIVKRTAIRCEKSMILTDVVFPKGTKYRRTYTMKCGVIFCNDNISFVADEILNKHPEIDYVMCFGMPDFISFRTQKDLDIPLPVIAKLTTGNGGGHPHAAGAVISPKQVGSILNSIMRSINVEGAINICNIKYR